MVTFPTVKTLGQKYLKWNFSGLDEFIALPGKL